MIKTHIENVLIVEDHAMAAEVLADVCRDVYSDADVKTASTVSGGKILVDADIYDIALIDIGLPDGSGIELIDYISTHSPTTLVIVTTIFEDENSLFDALRSGASGYLLKGHSPEELRSYLREAIEGQPPLSPTIAQSVLKYFRSNPPAENKSDAEPAAITSSEQASLTKREIEILQLIAKGCKVKEVGDMLFVSNHTVSVHIKNIYRKLNVHNRAEATAAAVNMKLLNP